MKIVIIGSGNTAIILGRLIFNARHTVIQIVGRNKTTVKALAKKLHASAETHFNKISDKADIYIIAVSDTAIREVLKSIHSDNKIIVHTSGGVSKNILQASSKNYGVLYPLQSLIKNVTHLPEIPFYIDGSSKHVINTIQKFARTFSKKVQYADDKHRLKMHVAAVFVSNFTNHLYMLAEKYCHDEKIEFSYLLPIIQETALRLNDHSASQLQTGPAARSDQTIIHQHLRLLKKYPHLQKIYTILSDSILNNQQ